MTASTSEQAQPAAETQHTGTQQGPRVQRNILNPFPCNICKERFPTRHELNVHDYDVHFHQCEDCKVTFTDIALLQKHRCCFINCKKSRICKRTKRLLQKNDVKLNQCARCHHQYANKSDLGDDHLNKMKFPCIDCGTCFSVERELFKHRLLPEAHPDRWCGICMEGFEDSLALTSHMRFHSAHLKSYSRKPKPNTANSEQTVQIPEQSGLKDNKEGNLKCELGKSLNTITDQERFNSVKELDERVNGDMENSFFAKAIEEEPCEADKRSFGEADKIIDEAKEHLSNILEKKVKCEARDENMKESNELSASHITEFVEDFKRAHYEEFDKVENPSKLLEMKVKSEFRDEEMISNEHIDGIRTENSITGFEFVKAESFTREEDMKKRNDIINDSVGGAEGMRLGFHEQSNEEFNDDLKRPSVSIHENKRFGEAKEEYSKNNLEDPNNKKIEIDLMGHSVIELIEDSNKIGFDGDVKPFEVVTPEARAALYRGHHIAGDLALGPVRVRATDNVYTFQNAMTASTSEQAQPAAETQHTGTQQGPRVQRNILNPFPCNICKERFPTRHELNVHDYDVHFHQCEDCKVTFTDIALLQKHRCCFINCKNSRICKRTKRLLQKSDVKLNQCARCHHQYANKSDLVDHLNKMKFPCIDCGTCFSVERELFKHRLLPEAHPDRWCGICMEGFEDSLALTSHMRFHSAHLKSYSRKPKPNTANSEQTVKIPEQSGLKDNKEGNLKCELGKSLKTITDQERFNSVKELDERVNGDMENSFFAKAIKEEPCEDDKRSFGEADKLIDEAKEHLSNILEKKVKCEARDENMKESNELSASHITEFVEDFKRAHYEEFDKAENPSKLLEMKVKSEFRDEEMISNEHIDGIRPENSITGFGFVTAESFTREEDMKERNDIINDSVGGAEGMRLGFHEQSNEEFNDDLKRPSVSIHENKRFGEAKEEYSKNSLIDPNNKEFEIDLMGHSVIELIEDSDKIGFDGDVKPFEVVTPEARAALYRGHHIAGDLALGPVRVRATDNVYTFQNALRRKTTCKQEPEFTNSPTSTV